MKITAARVIVCCPGRNFVTLKIETDQGLTGLGDLRLDLLDHMQNDRLGSQVKKGLLAASHAVGPPARNDGANDFHGWFEDPAAQRAIRGITAVWGVGLTSEALLRTWLAFHWPTERVVAIAPTLGYAVAGTIGLWTFWFVRRLKTQETNTPNSSADSE